MNRLSRFSYCLYFYCSYCFQTLAGEGRVYKCLFNHKFEEALTERVSDTSEVTWDRRGHKVENIQDGNFKSDWTGNIDYFYVLLYLPDHKRILLKETFQLSSILIIRVNFDFNFLFDFLHGSLFYIIFPPSKKFTINM